MSGENDAGDFSVINVPTKDKPDQKEKTLTLALTGDFKAYLVKARVFVRSTTSTNWQALDEPVYRSYSLSNDVDTTTIKLDKTIVRSGEDIKVTIDKVRTGETLRTSVIYSFGNANPRIASILTNGNIRKINDGGGLWNGRNYFADITRGSAGNIQEGYQFTLKGIKRDIIFNFEVEYQRLILGSFGKKIKILVRP